MTKGRGRFTLGGLMILVVVCGVEVFSYRRGVGRKAERKLAVSITDNVFLYGLGRMAFWVPFCVVSGRIRAANPVATDRAGRASDGGGMDGSRAG